MSTGFLQLALQVSVFVVC